MEKKKIIFLFSILVLFSLTTILAQPTTTQTNVNIETGLQIQTQGIYYFEQNTLHDFAFHVYNISTGFLEDDTTTSCTFHLHNKTGEIQYSSNSLIFADESFNIELEANNFSTLGTYSYYVHCNTSLVGGFARELFQVTPNGQEFTTAKAISYIGFLIVLLFTFFLTIYGAYQVRWKHLKSDEDKIVTINHFRYVKVFLFTIAYFELMFLFGLSYKFFNEANIEGFTQFFYFVYQLFLNLIVPLIIFLVIVIFVIWINNKNLSKRINLGLGK